MLWFYFALLSVVGTAISNIIRRIIMRNDTFDSIAIGTIFQFSCAIIISLIAFSNHFILPPFTKYPINFLLQAVLWGIAVICIFKASQYLEASEVTIITTLMAVVTIISAILFLKEPFGLSHIVGTILILLSILYLSLNSKKFVLGKGTFYALGYSITAGLAVTNDTFLLQRSPDTFSFLAFAFLTPGIFLIIIRPKTLQQLSFLKNVSVLKKISLLTLFYTGAALFYYFAIHLGAKASQISPINQSAIILTLLIAAVFLNERDRLFKKIICTILVTIGVFLLR